MNIVRLIVVLLLAGMALSCDGTGTQDSGVTSFTWNGTWTSTQTFNVRGTFTLDADIAGSDLTGTLVLYDDADVEQSNSMVSGQAHDEYDSEHDLIFTIDFKTDDNTIIFSGSSNGFGVDDLDDSPFITGDFTNDSDSGEWHTAPGGLSEDCVVTAAIQTSPALSIRDLCSDNSTLYAIADELSSTAVYSINPATGTATEISSICAEPCGIAYDAGFFWIVAGNETDGFELYKYDDTWALQSGYPKSITGAESNAAIGWHNGKIVCPAFFCLNSLDPLTAVCTMGGGLFLRADYAEGDGEHLWLTYSAPGYAWSSFMEMGTGDAVLRTILTPDLAAEPFTIQGGYLWTVSLGGGLYKITM